MFGMRGDELHHNPRFWDWTAHDLLRVLKNLTFMERGETLFFTICGTGMCTYWDDGHGGAKRDALEWAHQIHPDNLPACYEVTRNSRGYRIETLYELD